MDELVELIRVLERKHGPVMSAAGIVCACGEWLSVCEVWQALTKVRERVHADLGARGSDAGCANAAGS